MSQTRKKKWDTHLSGVNALNKNPEDKRFGKILAIQRWYIKNDWTVAVAVKEAWERYHYAPLLFYN